MHYVNGGGGGGLCRRFPTPPITLVLSHLSPPPRFSPSTLVSMVCPRLSGSILHADERKKDAERGGGWGWGTCKESITPTGEKSVVFCVWRGVWWNASKQNEPRARLQRGDFSFYSVKMKKKTQYVNGALSLRLSTRKGAQSFQIKSVFLHAA